MLRFYCFYSKTDEGSHRSRLSTYTKSTHSVVVMRKYLLSSVFVGYVFLVFRAQVTLKGVAVKMNSDFTPVAGVEVVVQGGVPTLTDGAGTFILKLPHIGIGRPSF